MRVKVWTSGNGTFELQIAVNDTTQRNELHKVQLAGHLFSVDVWIRSLVFGRAC